MADKTALKSEALRDARYPRNRSRRQFLLASGAGVASALGAASGHAAESLTLTPAAFDATSDSVLIWVCGQNESQVRIDYSAENPGALQPGPLVPLNSNNDFTNHVALTGLPGAATIYYRLSRLQLGRHGLHHAGYTALPQSADRAGWTGQDHAR